jgi:hypothetical protein
MSESHILGESNILGDSNRKSRFDPNLADEVNKSIEDGSRQDRINESKVFRKTSADMGGESLRSVLDNAYGRKFLQELFHTKDSADEIVKVLGRLSMRDMDKTNIYTPDPADSLDSNRAVHFYYDFNNDFVINVAEPLLSRLGRCYGVEHNFEVKR